jgi:membrane protein implicated in regulation of membrane protease activity
MSPESPETEPMVTLEVWQLALLVIGLVLIVFVLPVPKTVLLVLFLLGALVALLVVRKRKQQEADDF